MKLRSLKRALIASLGRADIETPESDARWLIEAATGWDRAQMILKSETMVSERIRAEIKCLVERRLSGEPIDHILGYREFYGRRFEISKHVLSPRPETEGLIDKALSFTASRTKPHILDLGTGSGAIIISLLAEHPQARGVGVDISKAAVEIAERNARTHNVLDRLDLLEGSWFNAVTGHFDLIVSNPPYISDSDMEALSVEVRHYDPEISLSGGKDGLEAYRAILAQAKAFLKPSRGLIFEIGYDQGQSVSDLMGYAGFNQVEITKDLAGHDRIISGKLPQK